MRCPQRSICLHRRRNILPERWYLRRQWTTSSQHPVWNDFCPSAALFTVFALFDLNSESSYDDLMAVPLILPDATGRDVRLRLVQNPSNPGNCTCGWYIYYSAVCTHEYTKHAHRCGAKVTPSGQSGFCKSPAPRNIVAAVRVSAQCPAC